jgi:hypothetical protein
MEGASHPDDQAGEPREENPRIGNPTASFEISPPRVEAINPAAGFLERHGPR